MISYNGIKAKTAAENADIFQVVYFCCFSSSKICCKQWTRYWSISAQNRYCKCTKYNLFTKLPLFRSIWHFKSALSWWHRSSTSKGCGKQITPSLCAFFNHPLRFARIPSEWKRVNVTPVHKNDRVDSVENCWPISLLCILSETLEHCVCRTLTTMI